MKRLLLALCLLCLAVPVWAEDLPKFIFNDTAKIGDIAISVPQYTSITFADYGDSEDVLVISWENGVIDVKYQNLTEAAEIFFEFLKDYIQESYNIIPKTKEVK